MKHLFASFLLCFSIVFSFAQHTEFDVHPNGLMYDEEIMTQLQYIVDSLDLEFRSCDLDRTYYSNYQAKGHYVYLEGEVGRKALKDMESNISFEDFYKKYPKADIERDLLIVKSNYEYYDEEGVEFRKISLNDNYGYNIDFSSEIPVFEGNWVFKYSYKYLYAFFLPSSFQKQEISEKYARMIQYADCMIDTTTTKFVEEIGDEKDADKSIYLPDNYSEISKKEKEKLLEEMRSMRVVGYCSQDNRPRVHAMNIAKLSAETINWEMFLRAHLDIMNDRFERMTDGSYAWGERKTYIKELEELNINVPDLIMGITLRMDNPSQNHYYGTIWRLGRALSETKYRDEIENQLIAMIADDTLDDYNRVLGYFLLLNYYQFTEDKSLQKANYKKLKKAAMTLPNYLCNRIDWKEMGQEDE